MKFNFLERLRKWAEGTTILLRVDDKRAGMYFRNNKPGDVGFDLEVWMPDVDQILLQPFTFIDLPTGLSIKMGDNSWGMIRPRSSTFVKKGLFVGEGTIDPGYTGRLFVTVFNPRPMPTVITNGERLAQLIPVRKFDHVEVEHVEVFPKTERGSTGFGSTGV